METKAAPERVSKGHQTVMSDDYTTRTLRLNPALVSLWRIFQSRLNFTQCSDLVLDTKATSWHRHHSTSDTWINAPWWPFLTCQLVENQLITALHVEQAKGTLSIKQKWKDCAGMLAGLVSAPLLDVCSFENSKKNKIKKRVNYSPSSSLEKKKKS